MSKHFKLQTIPGTLGNLTVLEKSPFSVKRRKTQSNTRLFFLQLPKHQKGPIIHVPDLKPHRALKYLRPNRVTV